MQSGNWLRSKLGNKIKKHKQMEAILYFIPQQMITALERMYPSLATEKREFYFAPSDKIKAEISAIKTQINIEFLK